MEKTLDFGDEKSLHEAGQFLAKLKEAKIDKKYKLIFNQPNIYKKKILSAHFVIKFENDFYLKVLKNYNVYDFEFISSCFKNGETTFYESRDYNLSFFDILCDIHDDIYFDVNTYYPKNFEETNTFKMYYEYCDIKNKRYYGVVPAKAIEFIVNNYQFIINSISMNKMD
jgi:hypothetical protein